MPIVSSPTGMSNSYGRTRSTEMVARRKVSVPPSLQQRLASTQANSDDNRGSAGNVTETTKPLFAAKLNERGTLAASSGLNNSVRRMTLVGVSLTLPWTNVSETALMLPLLVTPRSSRVSPNRDRVAWR